MAVYGAVQTVQALRNGASVGDVLKSLVVNYAVRLAMGKISSLASRSSISAFTSSDSNSGAGIRGEISHSTGSAELSGYTAVSHYSQGGTQFAQIWAYNQARLDTLKGGFDDFLNSNIGGKTIDRLINRGSILKIYDRLLPYRDSSMWAERGLNVIHAATDFIDATQVRMNPQFGQPLFDRVSMGSIYANEVGHAVYGEFSEFNTIRFYGNAFRAERGTRLRDPIYH